VSARRSKSPASCLRSARSQTTISALFNCDARDLRASSPARLPIYSATKYGLRFKNVTEHGFGIEAGSQLIWLVNPVEAEVIASFRAGQENATGVVAKHDYIPPAGAAAYLQPDNIVGQVAPATLNGLKVNGRYGPLWIIQSDFVPEKYVSVFATYGPGSVDNVIGVRQHPNVPY
jgi:hypothetical protein